MTWARPSEITADDGTTGNDGLAAEYNVLWAGDGSAARDFVARVLHICRSSHDAETQLKAVTLPSRCTQLANSRWGRPCENRDGGERQQP